MAISSGVPCLKTPPASTYVPSVFSRITTKSTSFGSTPLSGQSAHPKDGPGDIGIQVHLEAHAQKYFLGMDIRRHARIAERADQMASKSRASMAKPSGGMVTPSAR